MAFDAEKKDSGGSETTWVLEIIIAGLIGRHYEAATKAEAIQIAKAFRLISKDAKAISMRLTRIVATDFDLELGE